MAQKAKKIVPKRIGGVKVPKRLRRTLNKALANPKANEVMSGVIAAAGAALAKKAFGSGREADRSAAGDRGGDARKGQDDRAPGAGARATPDPVAEIGTLVAGAATEAVRGVARLVGEAVEGLRRDRGHGAAGSADGDSPIRPAGAGPAQSEPVAEDPPVEAAEPKVGAGDGFGERDDNDDEPFDGNDPGKTGPMTGVGP